MADSLNALPLPAKPLRVMVIDDSPLMRRLIADRLNATPGIQVVAASDEGQAIASLYDIYQPDVVTLDIQMPKCDGLAALQLLMAHKPVPVVMVSSLTRLGAETTLEALERGAVDYVAKPDVHGDDEARFTTELIRKIRIAAGTPVERLLALRRARRANRAVASSVHRVGTQRVPYLEEQSQLARSLIVIGISTGGPPALHGMFDQLRSPLPPIVIVQHMPSLFTTAFARRLDQAGEIRVKEAVTGDVLQPNHAYLAPGGKQMELVARGNAMKVVVRNGEPVSGHRPSIDVLFQSAARVAGDRVLGVIMTGMGRDGVQGCAAVRRSGGYVLGQDETTSDVYGMNKHAFLEGHVDRQFALSHASEEIMQHVRLHWLRSRVSAR